MHSRTALSCLWRSEGRRRAAFVCSRKCPFPIWIQVPTSVPREPLQQGLDLENRPEIPDSSFLLPFFHQPLSLTSSLIHLPLWEIGNKEGGREKENFLSAVISTSQFPLTLMPSYHHNFRCFPLGCSKFLRSSRAWGGQRAGTLEDYGKCKCWGQWGGVSSPLGFDWGREGRWATGGSNIVGEPWTQSSCI